MTDEEFKALLENYLSGRCSESERKMLDDFFEANKRAMPELSAFQEYEQYKQEAKGRIQHNLNKSFALGQSGKSAKARKYLIPSLVMLCMILISGVLFFLLKQHDTSGQMMKTVTENGQRTTIVFNDGSRVTLNSGTTLIYPDTFGKDSREVRLEGEAFFQIERDESRPFVIRSGELSTQVLGTSFNINAYNPEGIRVGVVTGKVKVGNGEKEVMLTAGLESKYSSKQGSFSVNRVDESEMNSWMDDRIVFKNSSLIEAFGQLERWYNVKFIFNIEELINCKINGDFNDQRLESVLQTLGFIYGIKYQISQDGKEVHVTGMNCSQ